MDARRRAHGHQRSRGLRSRIAAPLGRVAFRARNCGGAGSAPFQKLAKHLLARMRVHHVIVDSGAASRFGGRRRGTFRRCPHDCFRGRFRRIRGRRGASSRVGSLLSGRTQLTALREPPVHDARFARTPCRDSLVVVVRGQVRRDRVFECAGLVCVGLVPERVVSVPAAPACADMPAQHNRSPEVLRRHARRICLPWPSKTSNVRTSCLPACLPECLRPRASRCESGDLAQAPGSRSPMVRHARGLRASSSPSSASRLRAPPP
jgi:hypothetical protein